MKLNNYHLTYCTNIHSGATWNQVFDNLQKFIPRLKTQRSENTPFGIGLSLFDIATRSLLEENTLLYFQWWLEQHDLYVFTLNGLAYEKMVKDQVYAPDWSKQERLEYTLRLLYILAELLPEGVEGSISTLPISYKPWFRQNQAYLSFVIMNATRNIARVVAEAVRIHRQFGKLLYITLEPKPDGVIENSTEVIDYFQTYLLPLGKKYLANDLGISYENAEKLLIEHVRICYNTSNFAFGYEKPVSAIKKMLSAGIKIGKIKLNSILKVNLSHEIETHFNLSKTLNHFAQSSELHAVMAKDTNGQLYQYSDLEEALEDFHDSIAQEWRINFHTPIFIREYQGLISTQDEIIEVIELLNIQNLCKHLEIETYEWKAISQYFQNIDIDLFTSIHYSYEWIEQKLGQVQSKILSNI
jgi:hypothetical protein